MANSISYRDVLCVVAIAAICCSSTALPSYSLFELRIGAGISGLDLSQRQPASVVRYIVDNVRKHRLLVVKGQTDISAERQIGISQWLGRELDAHHRKHPRAQHPFVFRVSNDDAEGYRGVGNRGWHIDGFFLDKPHNYVTYYMPRVPTGGHTVFVDLYEVVDGLSATKRAWWDRIYTRSKAQRSVVHPLIYTHPTSARQTLCINLDFVNTFILDYNTTDSVVLDNDHTKEMIEDIRDEIESNDGHYLYRHKWEHGDFLLTDNLALGHIADADTQKPPSEIGLRVLHRVSVSGTNIPRKDAASEASVRDEL